MKWRLDAIDGSGDSYVLAVSPNAMESPLPTQGITLHPASAFGTYRGERLDQPHTWTFSGVLLTQAQYLALRDWVLEQGKCHLTDHLGRTFLVRLSSFAPTRAPLHRSPWRHTYQIKVTTYRGPL